MKKIIFIITALAIIYGCENKPNDLDGSGKDQFILIDTSGLAEKDPATGLRLIKNEDVNFQSTEYGISYKFKTDNQGIVRASGLVASSYTISFNKQVADNFALFGSRVKDIFGIKNTLDTIYLKSIPSSPIIINELFYVGMPNTKSYMFDLFVELYNNSDEIRYLDGLIITRVGTKESQTSGLGIFELDGGIVGVKALYAYQFPGIPGGNQYPIYPGQFAVVAGDAMDHRLVVPNSINLSLTNPVFGVGDPSRAQLWEFYNSVGSDIDDPNVPNVNNIISSVRVDYLISLSSDAVVLFSGKKGMIYSGSDVYIDITTVLDGVLYQNDPNNKRKIDSRIDAGPAGVGLPTYSGKSIERKIMDPNSPRRHFDTNNSLIDFGINSTPTPGYQGDPK